MALFGFPLFIFAWYIYGVYLAFSVDQNKCPNDLMTFDFVYLAFGLLMYLCIPFNLYTGLGCSEPLQSIFIWVMVKTMLVPDGEDYTTWGGDPQPAAGSLAARIRQNARGSRTTATPTGSV